MKRLGSDYDSSNQISFIIINSLYTPVLQRTSSPLGPCFVVVYNFHKKVQNKLTDRQTDRDIDRQTDGDIHRRRDGDDLRSSMWPPSFR